MNCSLFTIFKRVYLEVTKEKRTAADNIKEVETMVKIVSGIWSNLTQLDTCIHNVYSHLPICDRMEYVQKTLDLLHYGNCKYDNNNDLIALPDGFRYTSGLITTYHVFLNDLKGKLKMMVDRYKEERYDDVTTLYNETEEMYNKFFYSLRISPDGWKDCTKLQLIAKREKETAENSLGVFSEEENLEEL